MADLTDITGIGPTKAETLVEEGFESIEDIADAETDELAEIKGITEDRALEFKVEASDMIADVEPVDEGDGEDFDLKPADVGEELEDEEVEEEVEEVEEMEEEVEEEEDSTEDPQLDPAYTVNVDFDEPVHFHTFHAAIMRHYENVYQSHQPAADAMEKLINKLTSPDSIEVELDEYELNTLHTAVKQARMDYQGDNLIEYMEALQDIEDQIDEQRREYLF